jgi:alcohol dehydrogenase (cytochrome c)
MRYPPRSLIFSLSLALIALIAMHPQAAQQPSAPPAPAAAAPQQPGAPPAPAPAPAVVVPMPDILKNYQPVTIPRLQNPEPQNWLMVNGTWDGWRYSTLNQINTKNASQLQLMWSFATGVVNTHEAAPLVNNGVMFMSAPGNQCIAIDVRTGNVLWRYRRPIPPGSILMHPVTRGVSLIDDKVIFATNINVVVALDARTGKEIWASEPTDDNKKGYYLTASPMITADRKIIIGTAGGEFGTRDWILALDPDTGKQIWRCYTIPAPGEPGHETWPQGTDEWTRGGGSTWVVGNYDPKTNLIYWGTGNGGPYMGDLRPGDNLYTSSTIVVDAATGKIVSHFQYEWNESADWDEVTPPLLIDFQRNGKTISGLVDFARNGYLYFFDRSNRKMQYLESVMYDYNNLFTSIDPKTGRPTYNMDNFPRSTRAALICPMWLGAKNWTPSSFDPKLRLIYAGTSWNLCGERGGSGPITYREGATFMEAPGGSRAFVIRDNSDHVGELQAWNVDTAKKVWAHPYPDTTTWAGSVSTAGGITCAAGGADRKFRCFESATGKVLWEFPVSSGIEAPPSTFMVDGRQYIAVQSGWGGDGRGIQARLNSVRPGMFPEVPDGGAVWVFALPQAAKPAAR